MVVFSDNHSRYVVSVRTTDIIPVNIYLSPANNVEFGTTVSIVDEAGLALTRNITIHSFTSDQIIGQSSFTLNDNYNMISFYSDGVSTWYIGST